MTTDTSPSAPQPGASSRSVCPGASTGPPAANGAVRGGRAGDLSDLEQRILSLLRRRASVEHPYLQAELAADARVPTSDPVRKLQEILRKLTIEHHVPIVTTCGRPAGVFIAASVDETQEYVENLRSRALGCFQRMKALDLAATVEFVGDLQKDLPLSAPDPPSDPEKNRARSPEAPTRTCHTCRRPFPRWRKDRRFCSDRCRMIWHGRVNP